MRVVAMAIGLLLSFFTAPSAWADQTPAVFKSQVLLRNAIVLKNGQSYYGASAFLLNRGGTLYAVTSKQVVLNDHFKPTPDLAKPGTLEAWSFYIPGTDNLNLRASKLVSAPDSTAYGPMALSIQNPDVAAGIAGLSLALAPAKIGDVLYLPACSVKDQACRQKVYRFKLIDQKGVDMLLEPLDGIAGVDSIAGAPAVNAKGQVVALGLGILETGNFVGKATFVSLDGFAARIKP